MAPANVRVLVVGTGGVGTMAAYALESGGKAKVTAVMRSNYSAVERDGIDINSIEHGHDIRAWRPTASEYCATESVSLLATIGDGSLTQAR